MSPDDDVGDLAMALIRRGLTYFPGGVEIEENELVPRGTAAIFRTMRPWGIPQVQAINWKNDDDEEKS